MVLCSKEVSKYTLHGHLSVDAMLKYTHLYVLWYGCGLHRHWYMICRSVARPTILAVRILNVDDVDMLVCDLVEPFGIIAKRMVKVPSVLPTTFLPKLEHSMSPNAGAYLRIRRKNVARITLFS